MAEAVEMIRVKTVRSTTRKNVTVLISKLDKLISDPASKGEDIEDYLALLSNKEQNLAKLDQSMLELLSDPVELEAETLKNMQYEDNIALVKQQGQRRLRAEAQKSSASSSSGNSGQAGSSVVHISREERLPTLILPKFSGEITEWTGFWSQFESMVSNKIESKVTKFNYLCSYLDGEAKKTIIGMEASDANYDEAVKLLKDRYGRTDLVIHSHSKKLMSVKPVNDSSNTVALRNLFDTIQINVRCLSALGVEATDSGTFICPVLISCLPQDLRLEYSKNHNKDAEWDLAALIKFLREEVEGRETCALISAQTSRDRQQSAQDRNQPNQNKQAKSEKKYGSNHASASALATTVNKEGKGPYCIFCENTNHGSIDCNIHTIAEKRQIVYESGRCFICLRKNHEVTQCRSKYKNCRICNKRHNPAVCDQNKSNQTRRASASENKGEENSDVVTTMATPVTKYKSVRLQTAKIVARNPNRLEEAVPIKCLLDHAAQASFIKTEVARKLKLPIVGEIAIEIAEFGNENPRQEKRKLVKLVLESRWDSQQRREIIAIEAPYLCNVSTEVDSYKIEQYAQENGLQLADQPDEKGAGSGDVAVIIGGDVYFDFIKEASGMKRISRQLVFTETIFGWTLQGPTGQENCGIATNLINIKVIKIGVQEAETAKILQSFWDLEAIGIKPEQDANPLDEKIIETFRTDIQYLENRYVVKFPWKAEKHLLPDNLAVATKRMKSLIKRFKLDPVLYQDYKEIIQDQIGRGIAEIAPEQEVALPGTYYHPHQPVKREASTTTKLRVVLDGSSHARGVPSLNECLDSGPNLNPDMLLLLLRFRTHKIAITADIEKAFLQVALAPEERDSVRFLWTRESNGKIDENKFVTLRMTRVPFGVSSSPFLLAATIKIHAEKYTEQEPEVTRALKEDLYVDDFASGAANVKTALHLSKGASEIMSEASMTLGMTLRKWQTNSAELRALWGSEKQDPNAAVKFNGESEPLSQNILGLRWNPKDDEFSFDLSRLFEILQDVKQTKRYVLSAVARIFDPIGILGPYVIRAKFLFQELWKLKKSWDEPLPEEIGTEFRTWCNEMSKIRHVTLPRCYFQEKGETIINLQLHCFCDASAKAYATALYVRYVTDLNHVGVALVTSKTRVAPLKILTIPKLELMGCVLGARLTKKVKDVFKGQAETSEIFMWTDSTVALYWIKGKEKVWKPFVQNRAVEIQELSDVGNWFHCPGASNPADIPTRGASANELAKSKLWYEGPPWLKLEKSEWPLDKINENSIPEEAKLEERKTVLAITIPDKPSIGKLINLENYRSISKAFKITAYVFRFVQRAKGKTIEATSIAITAAEMAQAEVTWIRSVQEQDYAEEIEALKQGKNTPRNSKLAKYQPILNNDGLLCVGGRLGEANLNYENKHPIIIDNKQFLAHRLLFRSHCQVLHSGIQNTVTQARENYWIPSIRQLTRKMIHNCIVCRLADTKPGEADTAPLPKDRINEAPAFEVLGIDFAGPLLLKNNGQTEKAYICLFTCAVTRAIHLELVPLLTTYQFLLAFRRMIARRGIPHVIYTDNAKTFHRANKDLQQIWKAIKDEEVKNFYGSNGITWRFIVERAAWHGGWWERLVRSTKVTLKKVLGRSTLTVKEMETTLAETEAVINSRPLTYVFNDTKEPTPLSPAEFLIGKRITSLPPKTPKPAHIPKTQVEMTTRLKHREAIMDRLWKRWKHEYLMELRSAHTIELAKNSKTVQIGDVMQVHEDKTPKIAWKLAVVTETIPGRDGKIRTCIIRTANGTTLRRPRQLLYPLGIT